MLDATDALPAELMGTRNGAPLLPRLFVLSDFRLLRDGLVLALGRLATFGAVGSAALSATPREIADHRPDVLLLDASSPAGLAVARPIRAALPALRIIAFGVAEIDETIMACVEAGLSGFVAPGASAEEIVLAVHSAVRDELVCSPRTAGLLLRRVRGLATGPKLDPPAAKSGLTQREREIAQLMSDGQSNKQIARSLGIQGATVKNHVHSILAKLQLNRRGEVAAQLRRVQMREVASLVTPLSLAARRLAAA